MSGTRSLRDKLYLLTSKKAGRSMGLSNLKKPCRSLRQAEGNKRAEKRVRGRHRIKFEDLKTPSFYIPMQSSSLTYDCPPAPSSYQCPRPPEAIDASRSLSSSIFFWELIPRKQTRPKLTLFGAHIGLQKSMVIANCL